MRRALQFHFNISFFSLPHFKLFPVKKNPLLLLCFLYAAASIAQTSDRRTGVGLYGATIQYKGEWGNQFFKTDNLQGGFAVSISQYLSPSVDLGLMYSRGDVNVAKQRDFLFGNISSMNLFVKYKLFNGKILKENARFGLYLLTGFGASDWNESQPQKTRFTDAYIPLGAGFRIRISDRIAILIQSEYLFTMNDDYENDDGEKGNDNFLRTAAGLSFNFGEGKDSDGDHVKDRKDKCPGTPAGVAVDIAGCPLDRDSDHVPDYIDLCPDLPGQLSAKGCPDKDLDSIADQEDHCPEIPGPALTFGCPDRDQDGVLDADDLCPDQTGTAALNGCPDRDEDGVADKDDECPDEKGITALRGCPDRDNDGVADKDDLCPDSAGVAANKGCPEIKEEVRKVFEEALKGLEFETGKDVIRKSSYGIMDAVVKVMNEHPEYKLVISGHTDHTGRPEKNLELSQKRAEAAANYLVAHDIASSRISAEGYGDTLPVADNKTKSGRAKNRRVEFKVVF